MCLAEDSQRFAFTLRGALGGDAVAKVFKRDHPVEIYSMVLGYGPWGERHLNYQNRVGGRCGEGLFPRLSSRSLLEGKGEGPSGERHPNCRSGAASSGAQVSRLLQWGDAPFGQGRRAHCHGEEARKTLGRRH